MPRVDLVEETFVAAAARVVAERIRRPGFLAWLWPDLRPVVQADRGLEGVRWTVTGALVGSAEIWLQTAGDGVIVHTFLRADPTVPGQPTTPVEISPNRARRELHRRARHAKRVMWAVKDELEAGRRPGEDAVSVDAVSVVPGATS